MGTDTPFPISVLSAMSGTEFLHRLAFLQPNLYCDSSQQRRSFRILALTDHHLLPLWKQPDAISRLDGTTVGRQFVLRQTRELSVSLQHYSDHLYVSLGSCESTAACSGPALETSSPQLIPLAFRLLLRKHSLYLLSISFSGIPLFYQFSHFFLTVF